MVLVAVLIWPTWGILPLSMVRPYLSSAIIASTAYGSHLGRRGHSPRVPPTSMVRLILPFPQLPNFTAAAFAPTSCMIRTAMQYPYIIIQNPYTGLKKMSTPSRIVIIINQSCNNNTHISSLSRHAGVPLPVTGIVTRAGLVAS